MKDAAPFLAIPCIILVIFACVVSNLCGYDKGIDKMKEAAIREGHAEWVADATGKPQFKWKECK
jgi:hypothetical protein